MFVRDSSLTTGTDLPEAARLPNARLAWVHLRIAFETGR